MHFPAMRREELLAFTTFDSEAIGVAHGAFNLPRQPTAQERPRCTCEARVLCFLPPASRPKL